MSIKLGAATLLRHPMTNRAGAMAVAKEAEALGFDYLSGNDHVVIPKEIESPYPYEASHKWSGTAFGECLDVLTTLAFLSGCTERLRLLSSVLVVPYRPAVITAKMLATADVLSNGRIIAGCGVGWMPEEFEALGAPEFAERGTVTDEYLAAFKELWTAEAPSFAGKYVNFSNLNFEPKPIQKGGVPIWIGGEAPPALRRVIRYGDGWYPASRNPKRPLDTVARMKEAIEDFRRRCADAGRDPATLDIALLVLWPVSWKAELNDDGQRKLMTGTKDEIADDLHSLERAGLTHVTLTFQTPDLTETLHNMRRFAEEIMAGR